MIKLKTLINEFTFKKMRVYDFDDTLVTTNSFVYVTQASGEKLKLTPGEYALYNPQEGDQFDYSDFADVKEPQHVKHVMRLFMDSMSRDDKRRNVILTARGSEARANIIKFIVDLGVGNKVELITLGNSDPEAKSAWIKNQLLKNPQIRDVTFSDDSPKNIQAVDKLKGKFPHVNIETYLVND